MDPKAQQHVSVLRKMEYHVYRDYREIWKFFIADF